MERDPVADVEAVGDSTYEIWLAGLELVTVDGHGALVVYAPPQLQGRIEQRFGRVLAACAERAGHGVRLADDVERAALDGFPEPPVAGRRRELDIEQTEAS